ncbi:hypothetical protein DFJ73DRAFT_857795 [Zopfochytrium polystomum]|nr:hypothetical protein DFJ73DRAFT_857795 [Zopfochytrium polystomum]
MLLFFSSLFYKANTRPSLYPLLFFLLSLPALPSSLAPHHPPGTRCLEFFSFVCVCVCVCSFFFFVFLLSIRSPTPFTLCWWLWVYVVGRQGCDDVGRG